ncbi:MAG TPA: type II secretion system protein GspD, partial [Burkholderiaceae bacterium]
NVPFITGQYTTGASGGSTGVNPFQTVERKDVGLQLTIRPQISEGGTVKMKIYQESSNVSSSANSAGIITNKRSIDTTALADDGQILVLGGLIEDSTSDGVEKVPGLGNIPIIGNLFKYQKRGRKKTNLMVFLRPTIIRSSQENASLLQDRYDYMRALEMQAQPAPSVVLPQTGGPVLPELVNGRPVSGPLIAPIPKTAQPTPAPGSGVAPVAPKK